MISLREATRREIEIEGQRCSYHALPILRDLGAGDVSRIPVSLRIVLESVLRSFPDEDLLEDHVRALANWRPRASRDREVPFIVGRLVLNCAAGIPLLGDLTAIRSAVERLGFSADTVAPRVPVDMALDHTLTVDVHGTPNAMVRNMELDIRRNAERYRFVKWAMQAYDGIRLFPPGTGILHQLNLEFLAPGLMVRDGVCYPDTLVGTDSHTCMITGLGSVGWGVGGIEAQAALLGEPIYFLMPDVVGVHVTGARKDGVTATDLVLHVTEMLRKVRVVGSFVEFFGDGLAHLSAADRATIANMAPEYGATIGYFPVDSETCRYLRQTGRPEERVRAVEAYFRAQESFGAPAPGEVSYTRVIELDLGQVEPCVAGPTRPQDRVSLPQLRSRFEDILRRPVAQGGYGRKSTTDSQPEGLKDGDVVIAAITSCTNTSNPDVMLAAGLLAKKAVVRGLRTRPWVKTSLTPGSVAVSKYLEANGLQRYLDELGFAVAGYSCATCVGASGPLDPEIEQAIAENDLVVSAVLSGNRNFEARIHPSVRAAFLASPPLVVAFALVGRIGIDLETEPVGHDAQGSPIFLRDLWPNSEELASIVVGAADPSHYREVYSSDATTRNPHWSSIPETTGKIYPWQEVSTYLKEPPFLTEKLKRSVLSEIREARALAILGDSTTTDHISPIGVIKHDSAAGLYLQSLGVQPAEFNNYGARRMNHEVMIRGAFSNPRVRNRMTPDVEGGITTHQPTAEQMTVYEAAMRYAREDVPLIVLAGHEYGTGSARDWAAKATRLLGIRAVVAESFERIHRSNLIGMGVLPCQFLEGASVDALGLDGSEMFDILGLDEGVRPCQRLTLVVRRAAGRHDEVPLVLRADTPAELAYLRAGGLMPYLLGRLTEGAPPPGAAMDPQAAA